MKLLDSAKRRWFSVMLYSIFSAFFLIAGIVSTSTYVTVVAAQDQVVLDNVSFGTEELGDGTLEVRFSIDLVNPSRYNLWMQAVVWEAFIINGTSGPGWYIPIASDYIGSTEYVEVPAHDRKIFEFFEIVSDEETLAKLNWLVGNATSSGTDCTIETLQYTHEFYAVAWIGDFKHDYLREMYLNDIVRIQLEYSSEAGL